MSRQSNHKQSFNDIGVFVASFEFVVEDNIYISEYYIYENVLIIKSNSGDPQIEERYDSKDDVISEVEVRLKDNDLELIDINKDYFNNSFVTRYLI